MTSEYLEYEVLKYLRYHRRADGYTSATIAKALKKPNAAAAVHHALTRLETAGAVERRGTIGGGVGGRGRPSIRWGATQ